MIRVKIIKPGSKYQVGDILYISRNEAFGLMDSGFAIKTKDMTQMDYKISDARPIRRKRRG